jgi:hypothetical protein
VHGGDDVLFVSRVGDDLFGELRRFTRRDHPADDIITIFPGGSSLERFR